jgi:hypothetical protein
VTVAFLAVSFAGLSAMACDSCYGAERDRFNPSFDTAFRVLLFGLTAPAALLAAGVGPALGEAAHRRPGAPRGPRARLGVVVFLVFVSPVGPP